MKFTIAALVGLATANDLEYLSHLNRYGKSYITMEEYNYRKSIFMENKKKIEEHNANPENTSTLGENHMMDWTEGEFQKLLGFKNGHNRTGEKYVPHGKTVASEVDWRK